MVAQVIFFFALSLLIVLVLRRFSVSGVWLAKTGNLAAHYGKQLLQFGAKYGSALSDRARRSTGFSQGFGRSNRAGVDKLPPNGFWQEETLEEKPELYSHFDEGDSLFKQGKFAEAERFFLKAATNRPNDPRIYARLGVIYLNQKNYSDAIESLKVAVKLDKYNPGRHYNLALAYWGNKDKQKAIASVREAISLDPVTAKYRQFLEQLLESK